MNGNLVGELLTIVRTGKTELVRQNALDLLYKLAADGMRGARGAIASVERAKAFREARQEHPLLKKDEYADNKNSSRETTGSN
jgi:hypothetical protein